MMLQASMGSGNSTLMSVWPAVSEIFLARCHVVTRFFRSTTAATDLTRFVLVNLAEEGTYDFSDECTNFPLK